MFAWNASVGPGAVWLRVTAQPPHSLAVVVDPSSLCESLSQVLAPVSQLGIITLTAQVDYALAPVFSRQLPVAMQVAVPVLTLQTPQLSSFLRSGALTALRDVTVTNSGTAALVVTAVEVIGSPWVAVHASHVGEAVDPLQSVVLQLTATLLRATPDTYDVTVILQTNVPRCDGATQAFSVPWTIRVADVLLVPGDAAMTVSADQATASTLDFTLVNVGADDLYCDVSVTVNSSVIASQLVVSPSTLRSDVGSLITVAVQTGYPQHLKLSAAVTAFGGAVLVRCSQSDRPFAAAQSALTLRFLTGALNSVTSRVVPLSTQLTIGDNIVFRLFARDAAENVISDPQLVLEALNVDVRGDVAPLSVPLLLSQADGLFEVTATTAAIVHGAALVGVSVNNRTVASGGQWLVTFTAPHCAAHMSLQKVPPPACVCAPGAYLDNAACVVCPQGTFKQSEGNTSLSGCVACKTDWYCLPGSSAPTAPCPGKGFRCSSGALTVRPGYYLSNFTPDNVAANSSFLLPVLCTLQAACPNADGSCAAGHTGMGCGECVDGYVMIRGRCCNCAASAVSGTLFFAVVCVIVGCAAVVVTLKVEEPGAHRRLSTWIDVAGGQFHAVLAVLLDFLQLLALQVLVIPHLPTPHVWAVLSFTGLALSPALWTPTVCLMRESSAPLVLLITAVVGMGVLATLGSMYLAPVIWKRATHSPRSVLRRLWVCLRGLLWSYYPGLTWAVVAQTGASNSARIAVTCLGCVVLLLLSLLLLLLLLLLVLSLLLLLLLQLQ